MMKAIERKTGKEVAAERVTLDNGKSGYTVEGKVYAESTFKKNFKVTGDTISTSDSLEEIEVKLATFTGMVIGGGTYTAKRVKGGYEVQTNKKGVQKFDTKGNQIDAKNPKFANHIIFA